MDRNVGMASCEYGRGSRRTIQRLSHKSSICCGTQMGASHANDITSRTRGTEPETAEMRIIMPLALALELGARTEYYFMAKQLINATADSPRLQ